LELNIVPEKLFKGTIFNNIKNVGGIMKKLFLTLTILMVFLSLAALAEDYKYVISPFAGYHFLVTKRF